MGNVLAQDGGRTEAHRPHTTTLLPADLHEAKQVLLTRAHTRGVTFAGWVSGQAKVYLGSLGLDWAHPHNRNALVDLVRSGELRFARADLVSAMDPEMVAASEVSHSGATWHFLVLTEAL
jgi:hypothetical protein